jgi:excisionase family DNA binding protein
MPQNGSVDAEKVGEKKHGAHQENRNSPIYCSGRLQRPPGAGLRALALDPHRVRIHKVNNLGYDCAVREMSAEPKYLSVRETASRLGVHENTVRNWVRNGILPSARLPGTRFHRFDEREVERLRQDRGASVSSLERDRRVVGPELVDATQLSQWASTRDAQAKFPELMRRLLASTPGITNVSVRAGEGVELPGWDGRADSAGTAFLPSGSLFFEFGVGAHPKSKADEDFAKRRSAPLAAVPAESVFVFVTPRRWSGAAQWEAERRKESSFAEVRVLDADDLEGWLQATPAVHQWISEELGRWPRHAETLERWWSRFRSQTVPDLPAALFLAGRDEERQKLVEFFRQPPDAIALQAAWREDAIAFVCATIESLEAPDRVQPPLIISSKVVWERVIHEPGRMTLLPIFDQPDVARAVAQRHHVVLPLGREQVAREIKIELPRPHRQAAAEALKAAGLDSDRAYRLAALARRSMPSLVRSLARDPRLSRPPWSRPPAADVLAPLALLGAWDATVRDDLEIVSRIAGEHWEQTERKLRHWLSTDDPPFVHSGSQWHLASPEEAFLVLRAGLTAGDLERWHGIAVKVLLEPDPRLELRPEERPMAGVWGVARQHSSVLRKGVAEGIALVGSIEDEQLADRSTGAEHASAVVRDILEQASEDDSGHTWRSLADVLPLLAEAAPEVFLDAVHDDLDRQQPLLATMFQDRDTSSGLYSSSPHTGLLWALETLCWSSRSIVEATRALARLHQVDPGGRLSNRPLESLQSVLVGWIRHTSAPLELRVKVLESICQQTSDVGWRLLFALWPETHAIASPPSAPRFRDWRPESQTVSIAEWVQYIGHLVGLAIRLADSDPERWAQLAEHLAPLPPSDRDRVLDFLERVSDPNSLTHDQRLLVWERLHKEISQHRRFADADWSLDDAPLRSLEGIATRLEPTESAERFSYLFDWHPDLPDVDLDDHEAYEERLLQLRVNAINETLIEPSLDGLRRLAERSPVATHLGWTLGAVAPEELTPALMRWLDSDDAKLREAAASWASRKLHDQGGDWLREALADAEITAPARAAVVLGAPPTREVWDTLLEIDADLFKAYWEGSNPWRVAPEDAEYATRQLVAHNRVWTAVDLLAMQAHGEADERSTVTPELVQEVLQAALVADPTTARSQSLGYEIGQLLDYLESEAVDAEKLASYEFMFFRLLEHHRRPRALFDAMRADPGLFIDLVKRVYRGRNDSKRQLDEKEAAMARHAWWVLNHWRDLPGLRHDGTIDSAHLAAWVRDARLAFTESDRADIGDEEIGRVLAASPTGADGIWPAEAVREIVETIGSTSVETGMHMGRVNDRGPTSRGVYDGGQQERVLAAQYREWAKGTAGSWPRTSRLLRRLAEDYEREARRMDERAEITADTE